MKKTIQIFSIALIFFGCSNPTKYDLVIRDVGFFDGFEDKGVVNIAINADTIAAISLNELFGNSVINGTGKYIIPGLINSHVHLWSIEQLKESYESGILVNLVMHSSSEKGEAELKTIARDSSGISFMYGGGFAATVPRGHPNQISRNMETINDSVSIETWVDNRINIGADYIKIVKEDNPYMQYPALPTLTDEQIGAIIKYADSKGLKSVIHASRADHFTNLFKYNPDGFVHTPHFNPDSTFSNLDWELLKKSGAFIIKNIKKKIIKFNK
jgi:imidazolonepropionase-like amidohydrolase